MKRSCILALLTCLLALHAALSAAQTLTLLEYWADDGFSNRRTIALSGAADNVSTMIDVSSLPSGAHTLYYRIRQNGGEYAYSPVSVSRFYKSGLGDAKILEYWFDGDRADVHRAPGVTPSDDGNAIVFDRELDLNGLTPGHHRMYYRVASQDGRTNSPVSMAPVMVKSRYDNIDPSAVKVTKYSIGVDDEEPMELTLPRPGKEVVVDRDYDVRDLAAGNHRLNLRFTSDAGTAVSSQSAFTIGRQDAPAITLKAEVSGGLVKVTFNSIPNDNSYRIYRRDANGASTAINGHSGSNYPLTITHTDDPAPGTYTYVAKSIYTDAEGESHTVTSNEASVTVSETPEAAYGFVTGKILFDSPSSYGKKRVIVFSDSVTVTSDIVGHFIRQKIPAGTHLTVTAEDEYGYTFSTEELTVKEGWNSVDIKVERTNLVANAGSPLQFDSFVEVVPRSHYRFKVKNVSRRLWTGTISVKAALKDYVDNPPSTEIARSTDAQVLAGSMATFTARPNFNCVWSDKITIPAGESKELNIPEHSFVWEGMKYYYIYFECNADGNTQLIALNPDYNIEANPMLLLVDKSNEEKAEELRTEEEVTFAVNLIMHMLSGVKEIDGKLGDFNDYLREFKEAVGYDISYVSDAELAHKIELALTYDHLYYDVPLWHFKTIVYSEASNLEKQITKFRDKVASLVRESKDILQLVKEVKAVLDYAKAYNEFQDMSDTERMIYFSERLLDFADRSGTPFVQLLKMYLDVTKVTIANAKKLGAAYHSGFEPYYYSKENQLYDDQRSSPHDHNRYIDFRIRAKKKSWLINRYFDADALKRQIYDVTVTAENHMGNSDHLWSATATFEPVTDGGYVWLRQTGCTGELSPGDGIEDMWMVIRWKNGRITRVPIRDGVGIDGNGVKYDLGSPPRYTITFQSATTKDEHIADIIQLDD